MNTSGRFSRSRGSQVSGDKADSHHISYRPEIDGLRAIAILPVVFYHSGFELFKGGFIGVDVFFVISGYLITSIILRELGAGKFSVYRFYERRARRILPALFFMLLVCVPLAMMLLIPPDLRDFSQSVLSTISFSSNFLFFLETGYFDGPAQFKPLLHTWSLAVEEQFYIVLPVFFILFWRFGKNTIVTALVAVSLISLALAHWSAYHAPVAGFYFLHTRIWELLLGTLIAFYLTDKSQVQLSPGKNQALSTLGLVMIVSTVFIYNKTMLYPGLYALVPTLGAVLIILFTTESTFVYRLLSCRPMVAIGLISYSTYLWHQPLVVFAGYQQSVMQYSDAYITLAAFLSFPLAWFSWKYIETPFRNRTAVIPRAFWMTSGVTTAVLFAAGFAINSTVERDTQMKNWRDMVRNYECMLDEGRQSTFAASCYGEQPDVLLWGDSHAAGLYIGLAEFFASKNLHLTQLTKSSCPPFFNLDIPLTRIQCNQANQNVLANIKERQYKKVIIHSAWVLDNPKYRRSTLEPKLDNMVKTIKAASPNSDIVLIGSTPRWSGHPLLHLKLQHADSSGSDQGSAIFGNATKFPAVNHVVKAVAERYGVNFIDPTPHLCKDNNTSTKEASRCLLAFDGSGRRMAYVDKEHLSIEASRYIVDNMYGELHSVLLIPEAGTDTSGQRTLKNDISADQGSTENLQTGL